MTPRLFAVEDDPRLDPEFSSRCVAELMAHWGEFCHLGRILAPLAPSHVRAECVREVVVGLRRSGFTVEGDQRGGYRVTRYDRPVRYYATKPGRPAREGVL